MTKIAQKDCSNNPTAMDSANCPALVSSMIILIRTSNLLYLHSLDHSLLHAHPSISLIKSYAVSFLINLRGEKHVHIHINHNQGGNRKIKFARLWQRRNPFCLAAFSEHQSGVDEWCLCSHTALHFIFVQWVDSITYVERPDFKKWTAKKGLSVYISYALLCTQIQ